MRNIAAIARREMIALFCSPLAYGILTVYLLLVGIIFYLAIGAERPMASFDIELNTLSFFLIIAAPLLTMRLISEEVSSGTIETLMTAPVTDAAVVIGKFVGAYIFFLFMLILTLIHLGILSLFGEPDLGVIFSGYLGLALIGAAFTALGLLCSSATRSQVAAGLSAFVILLIMLLTSWASQQVGKGMLSDIFAWAGPIEHLDPFFRGNITFRDSFYFVSVTCLFLFLSIRLVESRRWR